MPIEKAGFQVDVDARDAHDELEKLRREAEEVQRVLTKGGTAGSSFSSSMGKVGDSLKKAEPTIGKVATGVSGLAGTMGGAVGQTNALTGAVGGLAGAFAGGGLLAVGISAAVVVVGALVEKFTKAKEEAKALALEAQGLGNVAVVSFSGEASAELEALKKSNLAALGITASQQRRIALTSQLADAEQKFARHSEEALRTEKLLEKHSRGKLYISQANLSVHRENLVVARAAEENALEQLAHLDTERRNLVDISKEYEAQLALSQRLSKEAKDRADKERKRDAAVVRWRRRMANQDRLDAAAEKERENTIASYKRESETLAKQAEVDEAARLKRIHDMRLGFIEMDIDRENKRIASIERAEEKAFRKSARAHEKALRNKQRAEEKAEAEHRQLMQDRVDVTMQFAQIGLSGSQQVMNALLTGQQDGIQQILAAQLAATGQAIIGIGFKGLAEGAVMAATPGGQANAAFLLAAGGAAVGVGVAMGGAGAAWGHIAAGGQIGKALPESSGSSSRGGNGVGRVSSSRQSDGDGGPTSTGNTYIFQGGTFDTIQTTRRLHNLRARESDLLQASS